MTLAQFDKLIFRLWFVKEAEMTGFIFFWFGNLNDLATFKTTEAANLITNHVSLYYANANISAFIELVQAVDKLDVPLWQHFHNLSKDCVI